MWPSTKPVGLDTLDTLDTQPTALIRHAKDWSTRQVSRFTLYQRPPWWSKTHAPCEMHATCKMHAPCKTHATARRMQQERCQQQRCMQLVASLQDTRICAVGDGDGDSLAIPVAWRYRMNLQLVGARHHTRVTVSSHSLTQDSLESQSYTRQESQSCTRQESQSCLCFYHFELHLPIPCVAV